jgi:hypothetical protein
MPMINSAVVARGEHLSDKGVMDAVVISDSGGSNSTLSTELGSLRSADTGLQSELDATQAGAGLGAGGAYTANGSANYIASVATLQAADNALDTQAKVNADAISTEASRAAAAEAANEVHIDKMVTLSGVAKDAEHLGTFTGATIADSSVVKVALQSLETGLETEASRAAAAEAANEVHIDKMVTLSGVAKDAENLGSFSGSVIADNQTVKVALQSLETGLETESSRAAAAEAANEVHIDKMVTLSGVAKDAENLGSFSGATIADDQTVKVALQSLETGLETEISSRTSGDSALQSELDATQAGAGLSAAGAYSANGSSNYISTVTSLVGADNALDTQVKVNADAISTEASRAAAAEAANEVHIDKMVTLSGVAKDAENLGTFTGSVIPDSQTMKAALQALESGLEGEATRAGAAEAANEVHIDKMVTLTGMVKDSEHLGTFTGGTISDNKDIKAAMQELETALEAEESSRASGDSALGVRIDNLRAGAVGEKFAKVVLQDDTVSTDQYMMYVSSGELKFEANS